MNSIQRERFRELRERALAGKLTASEQAELSALIRSIEQMEVAQLAPATARLREERERVEAQNRELAALVRRKEALLERLRSLVS